MYTKSALMCALLATSQIALAGTWALSGREITFAGDDVTIVLFGGSPDSCIPINSEVTTNGSEILIELAPPPIGQACFPGGREWDHAVSIYDLPDGQYEVTVSQGEVPIGDFTFTLEASGESLSDRGFVPTEGLWWNDEQPGSGLAFNVDDQGRWFAALFIYDADGVPTFLTMQGDELAYDLDAHPNEPYAIGTSPLIRSEGGQCLGCPWTQTSVSATGDNATLSFLTRSRAVLSVGSWSLDLSPLPQTFEQADHVPMPLLGRHYTMIFDGPQGRHVLTVEGGEAAPGGFTGQTGATLDCLDCQTVDANGVPSLPTSTQIEMLIEQQMSFACNRSTCVVKLGNSTVTSFIDEAGEVITAMIPDLGSPQGEPTRIELRLLPEGWRP